MAIEDLLNSPVLAAGAGLLSAGSQNADLGTGLLGGLAAGQQMRQMNRRQMLADVNQQAIMQQIAAAKRREESRERIRNTIGQRTVLGDAEGPPTREGLLTQEVVTPGSGMLGGEILLEEGMLQMVAEADDPASALTGLLNATKQNPQSVNIQELALAAAGGDPAKAMEMLMGMRRAGAMKIDFGSKKAIESEKERATASLKTLNEMRMDNSMFANEGVNIMRQALRGAPQLGVAKSLTNFLESTRSQFGQIFDAEGEVKDAFYNDVSDLTKQSVKNTGNEANIMALATRMAKARGGANPSDKDVQFALTMIGANTSSVPAFIQTMNQAISNQTQLFNQTLGVMRPTVEAWARPGELDPLDINFDDELAGDIDNLDETELRYLAETDALDTLTDKQIDQLYDRAEALGIDLGEE